ncbi:LysM peptidoglycan-binding domain-containing protein [Limosilactobacillus sp.]|uniref:LysM peptidoglycan-binding domain-containing protein n=1 Tax=Limosilactobacillus sp. TaxID=2773925 RepID=UPI00345EFA42
MNFKKQIGAAALTAVLVAPLVLAPVSAAADDFYSNQTTAEQADITNWVANTPDQISNNMSSQHIDLNNLNGTRYIIQWGDTLSGISAATGISVQKLAYDNNIQNVNLIYAGDVLILNRDGSVPSDYQVTGNPNVVAQTKVVISNTDNSVNIDNSVYKVNSDNSSNSTTNNYYPTKGDKSPQQSSSNNSANGSASNSSNSNSSSSSSTSSKKGLFSSSKMSADQFKTAVENDINQSDGVHINFADNVADGKTIKSGSITLPMRNATTAKMVAKTIVAGLKASGQLDKINGAGDVAVQLSYSGSKVNYQIQAATDGSQSSSSSNN